MRSIKPLPETVKSSVRSSIIVFDFTSVVEELIFNSFDAGATKVSITVGVGTGYIKVVDNGSGITRDGLVLLGERYATSKFHQLTDLDTANGSFGFRGEALSSISDVSLLEIITKAHGRANGYRKVMKGSKCLYLGINDDRQDVGTTVIVRDLFYNQPVRRKQLQSSPRKVLQLVKECVIRFALVHLKVSFKVVDNESESELLCIHPSSSPLPLLRSGFGIEFSSSLHELDVSDGVLKLSGFISGPWENFTGKALQYFYINSRFICKGPIHKLLTQLAFSYDCLVMWKAKNESQSGKRSRSQTHPTYILNLNCPQCRYDLTVELSQTSAEFKEWDPILAFIEKAVTHFWNRRISYGQSLSHSTDVWKEGDNIVAAEEDLAELYGIGRKRCRTHCHQARLDLPFPEMKRATDDLKHISPCIDNRSSYLKSSRRKLESEERQIETRFSCWTNYSFQMFDGKLAHCSGTENQENDGHLEPLDNVSFVKDDCLENFDTKTSNEHVDPIVSSRWDDASFEIDADISDRLKSNESADCFKVGNDVEEINEDLKRGKSFLQSCSSWRGKSFNRESFSSDEESNFHFDGVGNREKWIDQDDRFEIGDVDNCNQIFELWQDERASVWSSPRITTRHDLRMGLDYSVRDPKKSSSITGEYLDEDTNITSELVAHFKTYSSHNLSFDFQMSPRLTPDPISRTKFQEANHFIDEDLLVKNINYDKLARYDYSVETQRKGFTSGSGSERNSFNQENCSFSRCMEVLDLKDYSSSQIDTCDLPAVKLDNDVLPKCYDTYSDEKEWLLDSCNFVSMTDAAQSHLMSAVICVDEDKDRRAQIRYHDKGYGKRPRTSHSAPPFYRGKKKFLAFHNINMEARKTQLAATLDTPTRKGICGLKCEKQSSDVYLVSPKLHSVNNLSNNSRLDIERNQDLNSVKNCELQTGAQHGHISNIDFEDFMSKISQDSLASGVKWRSSYPRTNSGEKQNKHYNRGASILDVSSGILYLACDSLVPKYVSKDFLKDAKVLQQVDRKFIPVVGGGMLAIIDQHAADERIRLEELRQKVLSGQMKTIAYLDAEQEMVLPEIGHQLLHNYSEQIQKWGWICNINTHSSKSFKKNLNLLHRKPSAATLLAVPCILGVNLTDADLLEFLQQLADTDGSATIPPSVLRVLNFKACRGAIMFGDKLLPSECSLIVEELKQTSLCFQCAHGRPTTAPLVNLEVLHKQIATLGLQSTELCHGLRRHEVSLERAAQRLSSA